ncbi:MAG: DNA polymerase IV [Candidatus Lokiarchaeota archaeon]|nr:DNA polymerase IV [Candidatus Lokiarchaeota archaeon]
MENRWIMLIDMDAFFASVEQYRNHPELIGRPVCVGHDPKKGNGRGVVRAVSYEARAYGIHSGMPVSKAYRLCPEAAFVNGEFSNYVVASNEFMDVLREYSDEGRLRRASIDEAYIEVTEGTCEYGNPIFLAQDLQAAVKQETSLPCSIGIAPNMSVAKIAAGMKKPRGITLVGPNPRDIIEFLAPLDVQALHGVGKKTAARLKDFGIQKLGQIQKMSLTELWPIMGKSSKWLLNRASGIDTRPLLDNGPRVRKSISKDKTFMKDIDPDLPEIINNYIVRICKKITKKLHMKELAFKTVTVKIRYADYTTVQRSRTIPRYCDDIHTLSSIACNLFDQNRNPLKAIRLIGVKVSSLHQISNQMTLTQYL